MTLDNDAIELAGCIILDGNNHVLLLHRNTPVCKQWEVPGGKIEPGETPEAAAIRELKEETGLDVEISFSLGGARVRRGGRALRIPLVPRANHSRQAQDCRQEIRQARVPFPRPS